MKKRIWNLIPNMAITLFTGTYQIAVAQESSLHPTVPATTNQQTSIDTLTNRLCFRYIPDSENVFPLMSTMRADGSWKDIDYRDTVNARQLEHVIRLKRMAMAYQTISNPLYHSKALLQKLDAGFQYFYTIKLQMANWWYRDIGIPNSYMVALILLKNELPKKKRLFYSSFLKDATSNPAHKGQNRVWVSVITIYKGCIEDNFELINKGFLSIASTLSIQHVQGEEGIKIDNSFHQHRPQLYSGGYGMAFAEQSADFLALSSNTLFSGAFSEQEKKLLSSLLLNGHQLFGYRGTVDFGSIGRNITRPNAALNISRTTLNEMILADADNATAYMGWRKHLDGAPFPKAYRGNHYFWRSDIMTQHGANYYLSVKMISTRTCGTESLNGENLKGYNLPLGATNILTSGNEYTNIFPVWDWTKVPGTTAVNNDASVLLSWYLYGSNIFSGGVSDGESGFMAYEHSYNGVQAKKAYFFMDDEMLCLGTGINALGVQQVTTTINQCLLNGDVQVGAGGKSERFTEVTHKFKDLNWLYHDHVGYIFPQAGDISLKTAVQSGSWRSINKEGSDSVLQKEVFSAWFNHGTAPTDQCYSYVVVPDISLKAFESRATRKDWMVIRNDNYVQAVRKKNAYAIVFYDRGTVDLGNGLIITCGNKALVMIMQKDNGYLISVSDPLQSQQQIKMIINQKLSGQDVAVMPTGTMITFQLSGNDLSGRTVSQYFIKN